MENASKALIIAGSVLLAIILISLGIYIVNKGQDAMDSKQFDQAEVDAFNKQFLPYEGTIKGSKLKALVNAVNTSNTNQGSKDASRIVSISGTDMEAQDATTGIYRTSKIAATKSYTVEMDLDANGFVNSITVT